jgi:hypothetical protein
MIFRTFNKMAGGIAGAVMYPLSSFAAEMFRGLILALVLQPAVLHMLERGLRNKYNWGARKIVLTALLLLPFVSFVASLVLPLFIFVETIKKVRISFFDGIRQGLEHGLFFRGFTHPFIDLFKRIRFFLRDPFAMEVSTNQGDNPLERHRPHPSGQKKEFFAPQPKNISSLIIENTDTSEFAPLTEAELNQAKQIPDLKIYVDEYLDSYKNFLQLADALEVRANSNQELKVVSTVNGIKIPTEEDLDDELIPATSMRTPMVLTKQYERSPGIWIVERGSSKCTDLQNSEDWLNKKKIHPGTRDLLFAPKPLDKKKYPDAYKGNDNPKRLRYCFTPFHSMKDALETKQAAAHIREVLCSPQSVNDRTVSITQCGLGVFRQPSPGTIPGTTPEDVINTGNKITTIKPW